MCKEYEKMDEAREEYEKNRNRLSKAVSGLNRILETVHHKAALMQETPYLLKLLTGRVEYDDDTEDVTFYYKTCDADRTSLHDNGLQIFVDWESALRYALNYSEPRLPVDLSAELMSAVEEFRLAYVKYAELDD